MAFRIAPRLDLAQTLSDACEQSFLPGESDRILYLPGVQRRTPPTWEATVVATARQHRADALFEAQTPDGCRYRYYDHASDTVSGSAEQLFARSNEATPDLVDELLALCDQPTARRFGRPHRTVGLLMCGENNILANIQSEDNRVVVRHGRATSVLDGVDLVFNGAHTGMGNWGKLDKRFEFLSAGRVALYATNNTFGPWRTAVRAYVDGRIVANGEEIYDPRGGSVALVHDGSSHDRFRAIRIDFPQPNGARGPGIR